MPFIRYSNFYENLYVRNESCYQGNGSCIYECLQNVAFIWKASPLRQLSLSPEWSILVVENEEEIERWESLFFEALEVVPTAGNGNPEDGHLDLNGDGKVDQLEKGLVKMVQLCKDLIAMGFTKLMVNGGEEMAPL